VSSEELYTNVFGIAIGVALLIAAIRWMFGRK
jgi:hypothetical protein